MGARAGCVGHHRHEAGLPQWKSQAGDELPEAVWKVIYPWFADLLQERALRAARPGSWWRAIVCGVDLDAGALSGAGVRGLMQVIPPTGRSWPLLGVTYRPDLQPRGEPELAPLLREMLDSGALACVTRTAGGRLGASDVRGYENITEPRTWMTSAMSIYGGTAPSGARMTAMPVDKSKRPFCV